MAKLLIEMFSFTLDITQVITLHSSDLPGKSVSANNRVIGKAIYSLQESFQKP